MGIKGSPEAGVPDARFVRWGGKGRVKIARHVSAGT
jgi:hypothetical protein